ncbi:MAG: glycosyltransferase [bacterium]
MTGVVLLLILECCLVGYTFLYALCNSILLFLGFAPAREHVRGLAYSDLDLMDDDPNCPPVAIVVPAFNEEQGITESVQSFLKLDYPSLEIVVVNDGSSDGTLAALRAAFDLRRRDVPARFELGTAAVRAVYESAATLPSRINRLVVVDKENGGRADALNCGINVCRSPYFLTIDADSILDPTALKIVMRMLQADPDIHAAGGQIGIVNNATVEGGRVTRAGVPSQYLPLCQTLEYLRSFTTSRTGFDRLDCLMILSGAFLLMRRDKAMELGGFLTGRVRSRLLEEYAGRGRGTIGEDMEMIVRLHRYERENGRRARIMHSPLPVCWTQVPSSWRVLGRQRRRWHRGFMEIMRYHKSMIFNPSYGRVGMFSLPYLALFELLGPYIEALGYVLLPILALTGILAVKRAVLITGVALGFGVLHSMISVLCSTWLEPIVPGGSQARSLLGMDRWRDRFLLFAACALGELGYRQVTVWWRLQGTWEYFRGVTAWGDMERKGFRAAATAAMLALALVLQPTRAIADGETAAPALTETRFLTGTEHRQGLQTGLWLEATERWRRDDLARVRSFWLGGYGFDRAGGEDGGAIAGVETKLGARAGSAVELRVAPGAITSPRWLAHFEGEAGVHAPWSLTWVARYSRYADLSVFEVAPGTIVYLPKDAWLALRGHLSRTSFLAGGTDDVGGWSATLSVRTGPAELRFLGGSGAESYLAGNLAEPGRLRARSAGVTARVGVTSVWDVDLGAVGRFPERGEDDLYLSLGVRRRW